MFVKSQFSDAITTRKEGAECFYLLLKVVHSGNKTSEELILFKNDNVMFKNCDRNCFEQIQQIEFTM